MTKVLNFMLGMLLVGCSAAHYQTVSVETKYFNDDVTSTYKLRTHNLEVVEHYLLSDNNFEVSIIHQLLPNRYRLIIQMKLKDKISIVKDTDGWVLDIQLKGANYGDLSFIARRAHALGDNNQSGFEKYLNITADEEYGIELSLRESQIPLCGQVSEVDMCFSFAKIEIPQVFEIIYK